MRRRHWRTVAAVMAVALGALVAETIVGFGATSAATVGRFADDLVVILAAALCLLRAGAEPRGQRAAWLLLGGALSAWSFGTVHHSIALWNRPSVGATVGDLGWLALYPLSGLAFLVLARAQLGRLDARLGIDVLIGASALVAFLAGDLREALASNDHASAAWASVAYTVGDLTLVAVSVAIGSATRWKLDRLWLVLLVGFMVTVVGDRLYSHEVATGGADAAALIATVWSVGAALIGLASGVAVPPKRHERRRVGAIELPVVLAFGALAIVVYSTFTPVDPLSVLLAATSLCAALVRLALTHRENSVLLDEADERAHVDPLTGLGNRRSLSRDLAILSSSLRPGSRLQLSLFDLDGFKGYNDRHGHLAGDELLTRVSRRMRVTVGDAGRCYRLGGDEFCLLASVDWPEGTAAPEGGDATVAADAAAALSEHGVRCSFGSVTMGPGTTLTDALRAADERMYADKRANRMPAGADPAVVVTYLDSSGDRRASGQRRGPLAPLLAPADDEGLASGRDGRPAV